MENKSEGTIVDIAEADGEKMKEKDTVEQAGKVTEIADTAGEVKKPLYRDANEEIGKPLNQNPKYADLIGQDKDPKKLIGQGISRIEKAIDSYFQKGDIESLQVFMQNFMHFPRDLVRKAENYLTQLQVRDGSAGHTVTELQAMDVSQLMSVGNKIGLFFNSTMGKDKMTSAILEMQQLNLRRKRV